MMWCLVLGNEKMRDVGSRDSLIRQVVTTGHPIVQKGLSAPGLFWHYGPATHGGIWHDTGGFSQCGSEEPL